MTKQGVLQTRSQLTYSGLSYVIASEAKQSYEPPMIDFPCRSAPHNDGKQVVPGLTMNMAGEKQYFIYIMTNKSNNVLYTGVTSDLRKRVYEHKEKLVQGFTKRYNVSKLVYYEVFSDPVRAILREKQIKGGSRSKKKQMIESVNKDWRELYEEILV